MKMAEYRNNIFSGVEKHNNDLIEIFKSYLRDIFGSGRYSNALSTSVLLCAFMIAVAMLAEFYYNRIHN
jgi:hypothetical protein